MTINTIVCFFVLVQAETTPDVKVLAIRNVHAKTHTNISDSVCKDLYSTQRTYHYYHLFKSVKRRARISFCNIYIYIYIGPYEIRFNFSQIPFYFFLNSFFTVSIFLDSVFFPFSFYRLLFNDQIKLYLSKSMSN